MGTLKVDRVIRCGTLKVCTRQCRNVVGGEVKIAVVSAPESWLERNWKLLVSRSHFWRGPLQWRTKMARVDKRKKGNGMAKPTLHNGKLTMGRPDHLAKARCTSPSSVELTFADAFVARLTLAQMGLAMGEVDLRTSEAVDAGLSIRSRQGRKKLVIDSATLRYVADPEYAARLDNSVAKLQIPSERLERIAAQHKPPQEWYDSAEDPE